MTVDGRARVKLFRNLKPVLLINTQLKNAYKLHWKPLYSMIEQAYGLTIPDDLSTITHEVIDEIYNLCIIFLKAKVSYCFKNNCEHWTVPTWLLIVKRSSILKYGTDEDKEQLPPATIRNQRSTPGRTRKRNRNPCVLYSRRQAARVTEEEEEAVSDEPVDDAVAGMVELYSTSEEEMHIVAIGVGR